MFWCKDTPVYVYGAGLKGKLIFNFLGLIDCNLCGFLDRTARNGSMGKNVFNPDELSIEQRKESIVVCSVANVFEHKKIATFLEKLGYMYIIYKSVDDDCEGNKEIIDIIWNSVEDLEQYSMEEIKSVFFQKEISAFRYNSKDDAKAFSIKETRGYIDVMVPTIFLYTFPEDLYASFHRRKDWLRVPYERNVEYYIYCADLFRFFEKGAESSEEWEAFIKVYKRYFSNADVYTQNELDNRFEQHLVQRYQIYEEMNRLYHFNRNFFDENPIFVKWNENRNCLYVRDGNNRLAFLMSKGMHAVRCRMQKEDFNKWTKNGALEKYIFSMVDKQVEARMRLQWMGKLDLLRDTGKILFLSDNLYLHDTFRKMGIAVTVCEKALINIEEYQVGIEMLGNRKCEIAKEINFEDEFDLIWVNLSCINLSDDLLEILNEQAGLLICEGKRDAVKKFTNQIHGTSIESACVFWSASDVVCVSLIGKDNMRG